MEYYFERLNYELKKIAEFWQKYALNNNHIVPEVSNSGHPVESAPLGSIYLSRLLYGSSAASNFLQDPNFRQIADLAYRTLRNQLSNVNGGFYWAADKNGEIVHDKTNVSMAQAFAVYGLSEYYSLTGDNEIKREIFHQIDFIESKLKHYADNSYLDGFTKDWAPLKKQYRSLGTHLHLLEAYTKFIKVTDDILYKRPVEKIIELILSKFINREKARSSTNMILTGIRSRMKTGWVIIWKQDGFCITQLLQLKVTIWQKSVKQLC